jgi:hypothetical protein
MSLSMQMSLCHFRKDVGSCHGPLSAMHCLWSKRKHDRGNTEWMHIWFRHELSSTSSKFPSPPHLTDLPPPHPICKKFRALCEAFRLPDIYQSLRTTCAKGQSGCCIETGVPAGATGRSDGAFYLVLLCGRSTDREVTPANELEDFDRRLGVNSRSSGLSIDQKEQRRVKDWLGQ